MKTLTVPNEQEFLDQFGETTEELDEPWIRRASFESANGALELSFDQHEKSIRFEWTQGDAIIWSFFREAAESLRIRSENGETHFIADFETEELSGSVDVKVFPRIAVHDSSLRH